MTTRNVQEELGGPLTHVKLILVLNLLQKGGILRGQGSKHALAVILYDVCVSGGELLLLGREPLKEVRLLYDVQHVLLYLAKPNSEVRAHHVLEAV